MTWREYQSMQRVVELGDRFLSYVDRGEGEPVVLLHGIPTWGYLWHRLAPALVEKRRVLVPDLLGFGYSDKSDHFDRAIDVQTDCVLAWLDEIGVRRAAFVGHDIGGGIALRLATLHPRRVSHLCLMNSVCYDSWPIKGMLQIGQPGTYRQVPAASMTVSLKRALRTGFSMPQPDGLIDSLLAPYATEAGKLSLVRDAVALNTNLTTELTSRLSKVACPTLIIWGEDDPFQYAAYGKRLAWDIPDATLMRVSQASHFVMLDQPEQVGGRVREFVG